MCAGFGQMQGLTGLVVPPSAPMVVILFRDTARMKQQITLTLGFAVVVLIIMVRLVVQDSSPSNPRGLRAIVLVAPFGTYTEHGGGGLISDDSRTSIYHGLHRDGVGR